jgi:eight-cysteine-cluster-containing protein
MRLFLSVALLFAACNGSAAPSPEPSAETGDEQAPKDETFAKGCAPAGCSGQICAEEGAEIMTTCEFRPEYACYRAAACERQPSGECGWTETPELRACLESPPAE